MGRRSWSYEETCRWVSRSMRETFPALFGERWRQASELFYASYGARHLEAVRPRPGASALLEALGATAAYLGVVSNKNGEHLRREVAHLGWSRCFGRVVGAADAAADKPARAAVELALEGSGVAPGREVWLVGDHAIDVACAEVAGCTPVLVRGAVDVGEPGALDGVTWRFESCAELAVVVRQL